MIAVFIILVLAGGLVWFINNQNEVKEINSKGYVYKVRYDFGEELYRVSGKREFNADDMNLTDYQD